MMKNVIKSAKKFSKSLDNKSVIEKLAFQTGSFLNEAVFLLYNSAASRLSKIDDLVENGAFFEPELVISVPTDKFMYGARLKKAESFYPAFSDLSENTYFNEDYIHYFYNILLSGINKHLKDAVNSNTDVDVEALTFVRNLVSKFAATYSLSLIATFANFEKISDQVELSFYFSDELNHSVSSAKEHADLFLNEFKSAFQGLSFLLELLVNCGADLDNLKLGANGKFVIDLS